MCFLVSNISFNWNSLSMKVQSQKSLFCLLKWFLSVPFIQIWKHEIKMFLCIYETSKMLHLLSQIWRSKSRESMCLILWKFLSLVVTNVRKILTQGLLEKENNKTKTQNKNHPDSALRFTVIRPKEHHRKHPCSLINDQPSHISQRCTQLLQIRNNWRQELAWFLTGFTLCCLQWQRNNKFFSSQGTNFILCYLLSTCMLP